MNRLMKDPIAATWRKQLLFYSIIAMMASLFLSRVMLSVSMMGFILFSFLHTDLKSHIRDFFSSPVLWGMSLLFFLPLISGLWSSDRPEWADMLRIKLSLLFLPLAFAGPFVFSERQWERLAHIFIALVTAGTIWSMFHYAANLSAIHEGYLKAKIITTPLENDHVRFSWTVSAASLLTGWLWWQKKNQSKWMAGILFITGVWLILFLHILAARTGLFSFYIIMLAVTGWLVFKKLKPGYGAGLLIVLIALPLLAYFMLPTFHNRVKYFLYDFEYFKKASYLPGTTDAVRVISMKAGWHIMKDHPLTGAGFGDVYRETTNWYTTHFPQMAAADKIYPSSEWLIYGAGCGWPGLLLFTFVMLIPFLVRGKNKLLWWLLNGTAAFSFFFDIGLEVQYGVFLYSFIVLWWWKWLNAEKM
jgi:O-antigen ligase